MRTAFILLKSPHEIDPSHLLSRMADKSEATAILIEDGVYHAVSKIAANNLKASTADVLVSADDLQARGFTALDLKVGHAIEYGDIIDCIMERTERTITI